MRKSHLAFTVLVASAVFCGRLGATPYVVTADFPYVSKYVFRGLTLAQASFQPSLRLTAGNGYAGLWLNQPFASHPELEVDFNAGRKFQLAQGWTLDAGASLYGYPRADPKAGEPKHTLESYLGLSGAISGTNLGAYLYRDFDLKATTAEASAGYSLPLNSRATLTLSGAAGGVLPDHEASYVYCSVGMAVPYKVNDNATLTFGANWATHDLAGEEKNNLWFTAGLTVSF